MVGGSSVGDSMGGTPLPPAVTQWGGEASADRGALPVSPFVTPGLAAQFVPAASESEDDSAWDMGDDEGEVQAMFEEDVAVTTEQILASAHQNDQEDFPVDAFIIPEDARRVPTGLDQAQVDAVKHHTEHPDTDPAHTLADRFEKLSRRLRAEDIDSLLPSLARGDRFDALLAGFVAGYFSASEA